MSELVNGPKQLDLPFDSEEQVANTAKIFSLADHRQRAQAPGAGEISDANSLGEISKALERKILDEVLAEAEKLPWYK